MLINYVTSFDSSKISKTDLKLASNQLWDILLPYLSYFSNKDLETIQLAFMQMANAHDTQKRKSGEFYIIHPVFATIVLANLKVDLYTICACLMHDVPEDTNVTLEDLSKIFDNQTVLLIQGVTKLSNIRYKGEDRYAENLRKMFVAISNDVRVVLIKLADRCHNLSTLQYLREDKQKRIAVESLEIYSPIAERLGISVLQNAIEELSFKYVYPELYNEFSADAKIEINRRQKQLELVLELTKKQLTEKKIPFVKVYGRAKKYYSIFRKIYDRDKSIDQLQDLVAVRIITETVEEAYLVLAELKNFFVPLADRYKDYITNPKPNGYQSIHLNVTLPEEYTSGISPNPFELQIRTKEMHEFAEYGVAAHFAYKASRKKTAITEFLRGENLKWVKELVEIGNTTKDHKEYLLKVKLDLFRDRIFVLTPKNDVIDLPLGSSVLDFAYRIHEDIGNKASIGILNQKPVKLYTKLKSGDKVEIVTQKNQKPTADWLNWVVSKHSKSCIKSYLKYN